VQEAKIFWQTIGRNLYFQRSNKNVVLAQILQSHFCSDKQVIEPFTAQ